MTSPWDSRTSIGHVKSESRSQSDVDWNGG